MAEMVVTSRGRGRGGRGRGRGGIRGRSRVVPILNTFSSLAISEKSKDSAEDSSLSSGRGRSLDDSLLSSSASSNQLDDLETGLSVLPEKPARGVRGQHLPLRTNLTALQLAPDTILWRYRVDVHRLCSGKPNADLTRGAANDHFLVAKRELCYEVYRRVVEDNGSFFRRPFAAIYDRRNLFFSLDKLSIPADGKRSFKVKVEGEMYQLIIRHTDDGPGSVDLGDWEGQLTPVLADKTREVQQTLELATSQIIFFQDKFVSFGTRAFNTTAPAKAVDLGGGKFLADGVTKNVKLVDAHGPGPLLALQTDLKKSAFFKAQAVVLTAAELLGLRDEKALPTRLLKEQERETLYHALKDLAVLNEVTKREFVVHGLAHKPAVEVTISYEDKRRGLRRTISIPQHYEQNYKTKLRYGLLPTLLDKKGSGPTEHHPMEVCRILPNQRVPLTKQTPEQMQAMIKEAALKPSDALRELEQKRRQLQLHSNQFLTELGIRAAAQPLEVDARVLDAPQIRYKKTNQRQSNVVGVSDEGNWDMRMQKFLESGSCGAWAAVCLEPRAHGDLLQRFLDKFKQKASQMGIKMGELARTDFLSPEQLEFFFKDAAIHGVDFILCFLPDRKENFIKDRVKFFELKYEVLTQCVRMVVARDVAEPRSQGRANTTLTNILAKANMKLGGLNYALAIDHGDIVGKWLMPGRVLMLGCDVNHPPPQSAADRGKPLREPSVVGFVGNNPLKPLLFSGEIGIQNPRQETVQMMGSLTEEFLDRWLRHSPQMPESVLYFRDGVSDGQFQFVLEEEVVAIRKALERKGGAGFVPKITTIVCVKRHNTRLYHIDKNLNTRDSATRQDVPTGTVVDRGINHPTMWEFFGKFHQALQGTAKPTRFVVIGDENGFGQDEIDGLCYALCHGHQIVTKSVSLPAPVYGAHEMAERGKRLWRAYNELEGSSSGVESGSSGGSLEQDWDTLARVFRVGGTRFDDRKHWA